VHLPPLDALKQGKDFAQSRQLYAFLLLHFETDCGKYQKRKQSQQMLNGGPDGSWGLVLYFETASASCL